SQHSQLQVTGVVDAGADNVSLLSAPPSEIPPPRAFTQGVGTVFQAIGVSLFLISMLVCCVSSFFTHDAIRKDLTQIGWGAYSVQLAITVFLAVAVFSGLALAVLGLGLQAMHRKTPVSAVVLTFLVTAFDLFHIYFF